MTIKILPTRLANQIAAGEVVERPSSVVKELVENSLDAGATLIEVHVEKGGAKLLRIRDNGKGISKDELTLALSRHATSKISHFDDLEQIASLGFRGEALASISSVSRLKLSSKPAKQQDAWQAYAEGRDMNVRVEPTAHPNGTTVEVSDLFFNTPARRKFLRADKTEFNHIDEVIKRIALSRFDVQFHIFHNGKSHRRLKACQTLVDREKRVAQLCGRQFIDASFTIDVEHNGLSLSGWLIEPSACRQQNDAQYWFVNGRMMRDKLLLHAIKQAYAAYLPAEHHSAFVLYLVLNPKEVDVNVHPAKHEVRFHQSRLVHDFVLQAVEDAFIQVLPTQLQRNAADEIVAETSSQEASPDTLPSFEAHTTHGLFSDTSTNSGNETLALHAPSSRQSGLSFLSANEPTSTEYPGQIRQLSFTKSSAEYKGRENTPSVSQVASYQRALKQWQHPVTNGSEVESKSIALPISEHSVVEEHIGPGYAAGGDKNENLQLFDSFLVAEKTFVLVTFEHRLWAINLLMLEKAILIEQLSCGSLSNEALLLPVRVSIDDAQHAIFQKTASLWTKVGIDLVCFDSHIIIQRVPHFLRQLDIATTITNVLAHEEIHQLSAVGLLNYLFNLVTHREYSKSSARALFLLYLESTSTDDLTDDANKHVFLQKYGTKVDLSEYVNKGQA